MRVRVWAAVTALLVAVTGETSFCLWMNVNVKVVVQWGVLVLAGGSGYSLGYFSWLKLVSVILSCCISVSVFLSLCLYVFVSVPVSVCLSLCISLHLSLFLSLSLRIPSFRHSVVHAAPLPLRVLFLAQAVVLEHRWHHLRPCHGLAAPKP